MEHYSENGIDLAYEITKDERLQILQWGVEGEELNISDSVRDCYIPFSIHINGETTSHIRGNRHFGISGNGCWKFVKFQKEKTPEGTHLVFALARGQLCLFLHYQLYTGIPVLRAWTEIQNNGSTSIGLEYISSFCQMGVILPEDADETRIWLPHNAWRREVDWKEYSLSDLGIEKISTHSTKRISLSNTGSWSTKEYLPMGALRRNNSSNILLWQI